MANDDDDQFFVLLEPDEAEILQFMETNAEHLGRLLKIINPKIDLRLTQAKVYEYLVEHGDFADGLNVSALGQGILGTIDAKEKTTVH